LPSKRSLAKAREIVFCTCGDARLQVKVNYHFANCPIGDGVDIDVADLIDSERQERDALLRKYVSFTGGMFLDEESLGNAEMRGDFTPSERAELESIVEEIRAEQRIAAAPPPTKEDE